MLDGLHLRVLLEVFAGRRSKKRLQLPGQSGLRMRFSQRIDNTREQTSYLTGTGITGGIDEIRSGV